MDSRNKIKTTLSDILMAAFWGSFIFGWVGSKIFSNPHGWIFCIVGGWGLLFAIRYLWYLKGLIGEKMREAKVAKEPCPHGVVGGRTRTKQMLIGESHFLKCAQCNRDEVASQEKEQIEKTHREAAENIRVAAEKLRTDECTRLTKLRTHKIEYLLRLSPGEFEEIVGDMYRRLGYSVERTAMTKNEIMEGI